MSKVPFCGTAEIAREIAAALAAALSGVSAFHPTAIDEATGSALRIDAVSLLSPENIQRLWVEMPATFTHFHPLGYVLVVMLGAGVAERSGFFAAGMSKAVKSAPKSLLTPVVALVAMLGNHAADAGYVVLIPLAGVDHVLADTVEGLTGHDIGLVLTGSAFAVVLAYFVRFFAIAHRTGP